MSESAILKEARSATLPGRTPNDIPLAIRARIALRQQGAKAFTEGRYGDAEALAGLYRAVVGRESSPYEVQWKALFHQDGKGEDRMVEVFDSEITAQFEGLLNAIRDDEIARGG